MTNGWASPSGADDRQEAPGEDSPAAPPAAEQTRPPAAAPPRYGSGAPPAPPHGGSWGPPPPPWDPRRAAFQDAPIPPYAGGAGQFAPMSPKPGVIPLRPLSLGDIFEGSVATIRGNPGATIGLAVILGLLICVPFMIAMIAISRTSIDDTFVRTTASLVTSYAARFVWYFVGLILTGMLISVLSEAVLGRRMTIGGAWSRCRPHVPALVGLTLLFLLIAVASVVLGVLAVAAVEASAGSTPAIISGVLIGIGWLLALVYCYVRVSLAAPAVVLERTGPLTALRRSWSLSKGQFWRILGITLLSALIVGVISGVLTTVVVFGTEMATLGSGGGTGSVLTATLGASTIAGTLISALLAPFQAGVTGLLYLDQRIRKEALDVSLMAAASQKSGVPR